MTTEILLVSVTTGALACALAWGFLWRRPRENDEEAPTERLPIFALDGPIPEHDDPEFPPAPLLEYRAALESIWSRDTPDLEVVSWRSRDDPDSLEFRTHQQMIELPEDREMILATIERRLVARIRNESRRRGRKRFVAAWHFFHLPVSGMSLVIASRPAARSFRHELFIGCDETGFGPVRPAGRSEILELFGVRHLAYRNVVGLWAGGEAPEAALRQLRLALESDPRSWGLHGWRGVALRDSGAPRAQVRRHAAFAEELAPELPGTALAALDEDGSALEHCVDRLGGKEFAGDPLKECLLAQAFLAFDQLAPAQMLCERVLQFHPSHDGARELQERIAERMRGREH